MVCFFDAMSKSSLVTVFTKCSRLDHSQLEKRGWIFVQCGFALVWTRSATTFGWTETLYWRGKVGKTSVSLMRIRNTGWSTLMNPAAVTCYCTCASAIFLFYKYYWFYIHAQRNCTCLCVLMQEWVSSQFLLLETPTKRLPSVQSALDVLMSSQWLYYAAELKEMCILLWRDP